MASSMMLARSLTSLIWRQKPSRQFTASQAKDQALLRNQFSQRGSIVHMLSSFGGTLTAGPCMHRCLPDGKATTFIVDRTHAREPARLRRVRRVYSTRSADIIA